MRSELGFHRHRLRHRDGPRSTRCAPAHSYVEDVSSEQLAERDRVGLPSRPPIPADLAGFDVAVITVPTPLRDGVPDLSFIETAASDLAPHLRPGVLVVLESTTYPGTTEELLRPALEQSGLRAGTDFFLGYSPERVDPGNPKWSLTNTPKVVSGIDDDSLAAVTAFYSRIVDTVVPVGSTAEAELVKLLENTFRHVNIALVNELAMFARDLGVDIWNAVEAAATKGFGFMAFTPGPGRRRPLPADRSLVSRVARRTRLGHRFRFVELANEVNGGMPDYVVRRVQALLNDNGRAVKGSRILLIGLAYKAGTSDWRESPATTVAQRLSELGADVRAHDAHVPDDAGLGPEVRTRRLHASRSSKRPTWSSCSPRTTIFPTTTSPTMRDSYWTPAVASAVAHSGVKSSEEFAA